MNKILFSLLSFFYMLSGWALDGYQILHSNSTNKPYQNHVDSVQLVETAFKGALPLESDAEILHYASNEVSINGIYVELGTGLGRTTNLIAALNPKKRLYTFDSYLGHPADWDRGDRVIPKDFFAWPPDEKLPLFLQNVCLIKGWFADTLPSFIAAQTEPIAFLHIDCEIYESTAQALEILGPKITDGTIILFDEFYNYPNYQSHEYKAFHEFLAKYCLDAEYLAYNRFHEQVVVRISSKSKQYHLP